MKFVVPLLIIEFKTAEMHYWQVTLVIEQIFAVTGSCILNTYWMWLILLQVMRLIKKSKKGTSKGNGGKEIKSKKDDKIEETGGGGGLPAQE